MTEASVNAWLKHWLSRQTKGRRPLILKDPSGDKPATNRAPQRRNGKERRIEYVDPDDNEDGDEEDAEATPDEAENPVSPPENIRPVPGTSGDQDGDSSNSGNGPPPPIDFAKGRKSRRAFLTMLSEDRNYCRLLQLLDCSKVSR